MIRPKVGLEDMLEQLRSITLDHTSNPWQRDGPDRTQFTVGSFKVVVQVRARHGCHEEHVSKEGDGALGFLQVGSSTGSDSVGTIFVGEESNEGEEEFEFVGAGRVLGHEVDHF